MNPTTENSKEKAEKKSRGRPPIYPWGDMQVGGGFITDAPIKNVSSAANQIHKRTNGLLRFECKTLKDGRVEVKRCR